MVHTEQWIWLPEKLYPNEQTTVYSAFHQDQAKNYTVAEFQKTYRFSRKVKQAELRFSGDTVFQLYCNDSIVATGPGAWAAIFWEMKPFGTISILLKRRFIPIQRS